MRLVDEKVPVGTAVVTLKHKRRGIVRWSGNLQHRSGIWYGIELEEGGIHDGSLGGTRYFDCEENKGIFVSRSEFRISSRKSSYQSIASSTERNSSFFVPQERNGMQSSSQYNQMSIYRVASRNSSNDSASVVGVIGRRPTSRSQRSMVSSIHSDCHAKDAPMSKLGSECSLVSEAKCCDCNGLMFQTQKSLRKRRSSKNLFSRTLKQMPSADSLPLPPKPSLVNCSQDERSPSKTLLRNLVSSPIEMDFDRKLQTMLLRVDENRSCGENSEEAFRSQLLHIIDERVNQIISSKFDELVEQKVTEYVKSYEKISAERFDKLENSLIPFMKNLFEQILQLKQMHQSDCAEAPKLRKTLSEILIKINMTEKLVLNERKENDEIIKLLLKKLGCDRIVN